MGKIEDDRIFTDYYRIRMVKLVNLAGYAGMFVLFVYFMAGRFSRDLADSGNAKLLWLMFTTCLSMLPFILVYFLECAGLKNLLKDEKKNRCGFLKWMGVVLAGFGVSTALNFLISLVAMLFPIIKTGTGVGGYITNIPCFCLAVLAVGIAPAVCEELFFRGCILGSLREYGDKMAIIISSLIFALLHSGVSGMVFAFLSGILIGAIRIYTGRFSAAVAVHFLNNLLAVCTVGAGSLISADMQNMIFYISGGLGLIITAIAVVFIKQRKIKLTYAYDKTDMPSDKKTKIIIHDCPVLKVFFIVALIIKLF